MSILGVGILMITKKYIRLSSIISHHGLKQTQGSDQLVRLLNDHLKAVGRFHLIHRFLTASPKEMLSGLNEAFPLSASDLPRIALLRSPASAAMV